MPIRNSVKAIIIQDGKLLCNKNEDRRGVFHCVPGGGQDYQEILAEALVRECREEASVDVEVGELLFVRDYIGKNHDGEPRLHGVHQVEFFFRCRLAPGAEPKLGAGADHYQVGVSWMPLEELATAKFYPRDMIPRLFDLDAAERPVYLGDMD